MHINNEDYEKIQKISQLSNDYMTNMVELIGSFDVSDKEYLNLFMTGIAGILCRIIAGLDKCDRDEFLKKITNAAVLAVEAEENSCEH